MRRVLFTLAACAVLFALTALLPNAPARVARAQSTTIDTSKWYQIVNRRSGKCLDLRNASLATGEKLMQYTCHNGANQKFKFEDMGGGYYRISIAHSHQCVDQLNAVYTDGGSVGQYTCHGGYNQQWLATYSGGYWTFNVRHSGKNLDVANGSFLDGALLIQYYPHGGDNQQFTLYETSACTDNDNDTWCQGFDCDDYDADTYPGAPTFCESGYDRDCNGYDDYEECFGGF